MTEVVQDQNDPSVWRVEHIGSDGEVEVAIFSGPRAEHRARRFDESYYG